MTSIKQIKENVYYIFAFRAVRLLLIVALLDFVVGKALRYYYFEEKVGRQYRASYSIEKANAEVLIFGASRAYEHYNPLIIGDSLKMSCYNTGCWGQSILYSYATLKAVLKRYTPKFIILDVDAGNFKSDPATYDKLSFLLPYYKDHEEMHPIIESRGPFEKLKLLSSIYPFNSDLLMIMGGNADYFVNRDKDINGYKPGIGEWKGLKEIENPELYPLDSFKLNAYTSFIEDCQKKNVKLFIACSPLFDEFKKPDYSISLMKKIAEERHVCFLNFTNDSLFTGRNNLFTDKVHLNKQGAEIYTPIVIHKIKDNLHGSTLITKAKISHS